MDEDKTSSPRRDSREAHNDPHVDKPEPLPIEPITSDAASIDYASTSESSGHDKSIEKDDQPAIQRTITAGTELSTVTTNDLESQPPAESKPWYKKGINPLKWSKAPPIPKQREISHEYGANFFSLLTFQWMAPIMSLGYRRPLELNDIWLVNPERRIDLLADRLYANFEKRRKKGEERALLWALIESFKVEFVLGGFLALTSNVLMVVTPFILRYLISFATEAYAAQTLGAAGPPLGQGLGLVFGVSILQVCQSISTNHYIYRGFMMGGQSRGAMTALIFDKAMKISGRARAGGEMEAAKNGNLQARERIDEKHNFIRKILHPVNNAKGAQLPGVSDGVGWSNGRIVNLMSTDTHRIDQGFGMCHLCWTSPIMLMVTLVLLVINLTYSALAGFALIVLGVPLLTKAIKSLFKRRRRINKITDERVSLTQEILSSVRFVKFFGWEGSFLHRLNQLRRKEIRGIQILLAIRNAINAASMAMPAFASLLAFITYALSEHVLTPAPIFSSLALFNSMRLPLNLLPMVIGQVTDALVSVRRIQDFLEAEDQNDTTNWDEGAEQGIVLNNASFTWEQTTNQDQGEPGKKGGKPGKEGKNSRWGMRSTAATSRRIQTPDSLESSEKKLEPFKLRDIELSIGRGELIAVIGTVGSGKSSLLAALAGDMRKIAGEVTLGSKRAFCPQYAWIQNTTVRENVLFGKDMDYDWYNTVIDACALRADLDMLPAGDLTEIGERGITVSGGQKQRLNIARAIYFNRDLVLMDDPLSAVDAHVGRHIFDNAICGLLKGRCRILATHQLHVLERCDKVIMMEDGRVHAFDTFDNLMANNAMFQTLMATTAQEEKEDEDEKAVAPAGDTKERRRKARKGAALMQAEERAVRSVPWSVYKTYVQASGTLFNAPMVVIFLVLSQCANIATSLWLSYWVSNVFQLSMGQYIGVYTGLAFVQAILMFLFAVSLSILGTRSSRILLNHSVKQVLRAPMSFFDTTPLGRITNRFAKDVDTMDNVLTDAMRMYLLTLAMITSVFILIIVFFPYFAIALAPLLVVFVFAAGYYRSSAREMKRHEAVLRSSVFARFGEGVSGISSIRAYGLETHFSHKLRETIDNMNSAYYLTFANQRWLSTRLDIIGNLLVFTTGILVVTSRFSVSPSIGGLVLSYILSIAQMIQFSVRQLAEVENAMNATERIIYYGTQLEEEAPEHLEPVRDSWPESGKIDFNEAEMRYRDGLPLVLQGFDMHVRGGERIGIVGRTGAGKSSIMSTLFRLTELSGGSIQIDGVDISKIGLKDLRTRLAIIPQDPTLFRGTIRSNLDPFQEHTDLELWSALRQADLIPPVSKPTGTPDSNNNKDIHEKEIAIPSAGESSEVKDPAAKDTTSRIHLDSLVEEEGMNFSLGQRQLMALARALVRGARIIVCDEATSSVDFETDQKIQRTIATAFKGCTLLCIAHRLKTIIGYDRICVMDAGHIAELDTPIALWEKGGLFRGMCERSGIRIEDFEEMKLE